MYNHVLCKFLFHCKVNVKLVFYCTVAINLWLLLYVTDCARIDTKNMSGTLKNKL